MTNTQQTNIDEDEFAWKHPPFDRDAIREHMQLLHALARLANMDGKLVLTVFSDDPKTGKKGLPIAMHFKIGDVDGMTKAALAYEHHLNANIYAPFAIMRPDLPLGDKGGEADVRCVLALVGDLDADTGKVGELPLPAPYVVETSPGNTHAVYPLARALSVNEAKPIAKALAAAIGCDSGTQDMSHVWRVPGTLNWPTKTKLDRKRPSAPQPVKVATPWAGELVEPERLKEAVAGHAKPNGKTNGEDPAHSGPGDDYRLLWALLPEDIKKKITAAPVPGEDRSPVAFSVIMSLINHGWSDARIAAVFGAHPQGIGARYAEGKSLDADIRRAHEKREKDQAAPSAAPAAGDESIILGKKGTPKPILTNAIARLRQAVREGVIAVSFDEFSLKLLLTSAPPWEIAHHNQWEARAWRDNDDVMLTDWLQRLSLDVPIGITEKAIQAVAREHSFHPVRDYLEGLKWDGTKRVNGAIAAYFGAERTGYTEAASVVLFVSAVARIMQPGCKADIAVTLEGKQGTLKSSGLRKLFEPWFTDDISDLGSKDSAMQCAGAWAIEIAELSSIMRSEVEKVKAFLSRSIDRFRPPYGRYIIEAPRQCIFIGTTNQDEYLKDETGNRRSLPVQTGKVDLEAIERDRDQLWAEAVHMYSNGAKWWLSSDMELEAQSKQRDRLTSDPWEPAIRNYIDIKDHVSVDELLGAIGIDLNRRTQIDSNRVARILKGPLNFEKFRLRDGDRREWRYRRRK